MNKVLQQENDEMQKKLTREILLLKRDFDRMSAGTTDLVKRLYEENEALKAYLKAETMELAQKNRELKERLNARVLAVAPSE
jgi:hypothetical protein